MKKVLLGVSLLLCSFAPAFAATVNVVVNDPDPLTIQQGETFTVTVSNVGFPGTGGATIGIVWNAAVLDLNSIAVAPDTGNGEFSFMTPTAATQPEQDAGEITLVTLIGNFDPADDPVGDFDSFIIEFTAQAAGASPITIDESGATRGWDTSLGEDITVDTYNQGSVTVVAAVPVPASFWLFGSALGILGWIRRRVT